MKTTNQIIEFLNSQKVICESNIDECEELIAQTERSMDRRTVECKSQIEDLTRCLNAYCANISAYDELLRFINGEGEYWTPSANEA